MLNLVGGTSDEHALDELKDTIGQRDKQQQRTQFGSEIITFCLKATIDKFCCLLYNLAQDKTFNI